MQSSILDSGDPSLFDVRSKAPGPQGSIPITAEMLLKRPSGDLFGWTQNAGMGWDPSKLGGTEIRHSQHPRRHSRRRRHARSRSAITPGTGKSVC